MKYLFASLFLLISVFIMASCEIASSAPSGTTTVAPKMPWKNFSAGGAHNCFIQKDSTVKCVTSEWYLKRAEIENVDGSTIKAKALAAGEVHNCAILLDDTVTCWNDNVKVNFGPNPPFSRDMRANINNVEGKKVLDIAAGMFHTCALDSDGHVICWGDNTRNQITTIERRFKDKKLTSIAAGKENLCGITEDETVICSDDDTAKGFDLVRDKKVKSIQGRDDATCAMLHDDTLKCWGNLSKELKAGLDDQLKDTKVEQFGVGRQDVCLITAGVRELHCFGPASYFEHDVMKLPAFANRSPKAIFAGSFHFCGLDVDDKLHCAGFDKSMDHIKGTEGLSMKYMPAK